MTTSEPNKYLLQDKNKFYNWIYPKYEDTYFKEKKHPNKDYENFILTQGQKYIEQFLVESPYRAILLYHGLGTGKTCSAIVTTENYKTSKHILLFIPASLRQNWISELSKCGNKEYIDSNKIYKNYTITHYNSSDIKNIYNKVKNQIYLGSRVIYDKIEYNVNEIIDGKFTNKLYAPTTIKLSSASMEKNVSIDEVELINEDIRIFINDISGD